MTDGMPEVKIKTYRKIILRIMYAAASFVMASFIMMPSVSAAAGYSWAQKLNGYDVGETFVWIASSSNGKILTTIGYGGNILTSSDYGANWTSRTAGTGLSGLLWINISVSASGRYQTALTENGDIWHSGDYGTTWTNETVGTGLSAHNWQRTATSSSGQYVVADDYNDIFVSTDYGVHWTNKTSGTALTGLAWANLSMSASGQYIYAINDATALYRSSDYGNTWTNIADDPSPDTNGWNAITNSADGRHVVAADYLGDIYTSSDYGATWTDTTTGTPASNLYWRSLWASTTGQYIVAMSNDGIGTNPTFMYVSSDYGATWTDTTSGTPFASTYWKWAVISASGERIAAVANDQGIFTADDASLQPPKPAITNTNITTTVSSGTSVTVNVLNGVSGYDADTLAIVSGPAHGTAVDPPGDLTYTPNKGYIGMDSLTYQLCAPLDDTVCTQATLTFNVVARAPSTGFGQPASFAVIERAVAASGGLTIGLGVWLMCRRAGLLKR